MLHAFDFAFKLRRHESSGLSTRNANSVFDLAGGQPHHFACCSCCGSRAEDGARVPALGEDVGAVKTKTNTRTNFVADNQSEKEVCASDWVL